MTPFHPLFNGLPLAQYHCAKADFFAKNTHVQGMVMRITLYLDTARTIVRETHEWYENRKDKLYKRVRCFIGARKFVEFFHPGSAGEVRQWTEYPGKRTEVDFYVEGRLDRMTRREEVVGEKVTEHFQGRIDHLSFRSVLFTVDRAQVRNMGGPAWIAPAGPDSPLPFSPLSWTRCASYVMGGPAWIHPLPLTSRHAHAPSRWGRGSSPSPVGASRPSSSYCA